MLNDEELEFHLDTMYAMFGDRMPNPEHNPRCFKYYVTLYKHLVKLHGDNNEQVPS